MSYLIGSGWFSDPDSLTTLGREANAHQQRYGGIITRKPFFSCYWLSAIVTQTLQPEKISILDACSPAPISDSVISHPKVEVVRQVKNFGHAISREGRPGLNGWARGLLHGAMQAYVNDLDYVYVEQDLLLLGDGFLERNLSELRGSSEKSLLYMTGDETPQPLQQSLIMVKHGFLDSFITGILSCAPRFNSNDDSEEKRHYRLFGDQILYAGFRGGRQRRGVDLNFGCLQHLSESEFEDLRDSRHARNLFSP
jgi:hypothetical protein